MGKDLKINNKSIKIKLLVKKMENSLDSSNC